MKLLNKNKALCLVPHPDDTAFSMGCTIKKHSETTFEMLYMTPGGYTDVTRGDSRYDEDHNYWKKTGTANIKFHYLQNYELEHTPSSVLINGIETILNISEYDILLVPTELDSNYDHVLVNRLSTPLIRSLPITVIEYRSASTLHEWIPNFFIGVEEEELTEKMNTLWKCFPSQTDANYFELDTLKNFHVDYISKKRGFSYCEMFRIRYLYL